MKATHVRAGLAESNGSLLPGLWRDSLHVTCGLTAYTPGSAPGPTLGNEYGKTLPFIYRGGARASNAGKMPQRTRTSCYGNRSKFARIDPPYSTGGAKRAPLSKARFPRPTRICPERHLDRFNRFCSAHACDAAKICSQIVDRSSVRPKSRLSVSVKSALRARQTDALRSSSWKTPTTITNVIARINFLTVQ